MMSNSFVEKFVLTVVGAIIAYSSIQGYRSSVKLKKVFSQFALLDALRHCPSAIDLPLIRPTGWAKQRNAGRDPCDKEYPEIKLQNLLVSCELSSSKKGIW